jgi:hypothetical protein
MDSELRKLSKEYKENQLKLPPDQQPKPKITKEE